MKEEPVIRSENHWRIENYTQRITTKQWKQVLLNGDDTLFFQGRMRKLKARKLGAGVVEIYKEPLQVQP